MSENPGLVVWRAFAVRLHHSGKGGPVHPDWAIACLDGGDDSDGDGESWGWLCACGSGEHCIRLLRSAQGSRKSRVHHQRPTCTFRLLEIILGEPEFVSGRPMIYRKRPDLAIARFAE